MRTVHSWYLSVLRYSVLSFRMNFNGNLLKSDVCPILTAWEPTLSHPSLNCSYADYKDANSDSYNKYRHKY